MKRRERDKEGKREPEREMEDDGSQNVDKISILRWDTISLIEIDLRSLPLCLSLREPRCQVVFSVQWVKLGANPSCSAKDTHKQHNLTSCSLLNGLDGLCTQSRLHTPSETP